MPNALHQQHLTPAQQATQAAITAPATHQDGKVPVRTGLAWAALGQFPCLLCLPACLPFGQVCVKFDGRGFQGWQGACVHWTFLGASG